MAPSQQGLRTHPDPDPEALRQQLSAAQANLERAQRVAMEQVVTFRTLFEGAPSPYLATDLEGNVHHANQAASALLGLTRDDLVGMSLPRLIAAESRPVMQEALQAAPLARAAGEVRIRIVGAGGSAQDVSARVGPLGGADGHVEGLAWLLCPPAPAHLPTQAPQHGAQEIVDTVRQPLVVLDRDLRIQSANRAYYATFDVTPAETLGMSIYEVADAQWDIASLRSRLEDILHSGGSVEDVEVDRVFPRIGRRIMALNARRLSDDGAGAHRILLAIEDVTARVEGERAVGRLNRQLNAMNEELTAFAYSVSHDLRAPLRTVDGFSLAILEDYEDVLDETGRDYLGRLRAAAQRMGGLIDGLLQLSRITRAEPQFQQVDLSAMAREIAGALAADDPERSVTLDIQNGLTAHADPRLLRAALENLLGNAWKFTAGRPDARIALGTEEWQGRMVYYVRDNGAGFDMTYVHKLFGVFQRLHGQEEFQGHGIGLATVQRIVRLHGGEIWAEGAIDQGATFRFTLEGEGEQAD
ncbi:MAG: PAS domain-containing protein [Chloroflexi bacterium]|nr:PAS domain-containing protein [Chloroflexota bacterium]